MSKKIYLVYYTGDPYEDDVLHTVFSDKAVADLYVERYNKLIEKLPESGGSYDNPLYVEEEDMDENESVTPRILYMISYFTDLGYVTNDTTISLDEHCEDTEPKGTDDDHVIYSGSYISLEDAISKLNLRLGTTFTLKDLEEN